MYVILRIGPYVCAETNYGGFPAWLRDLPGMQMRTNNEPFKREMAGWMRLLCDYLKPMLAPAGGPIILTQIENEYNNVAKNYGEEGKKYLQWCVELGHSLNLGIPWVMCYGASEGAIETINAFYGHLHIEEHFANHPDQPALWTEAYPGWYNTWGYPHHIRKLPDLMYGVARFFAAGGTGINYYMWHGGTNFGRETMYLQTTSYDLDSPLDDFGLPTTKAKHLAKLHRILAEHSEDLLAHPRPAAQAVGEKQRMYTLGRLTFLCNDDEQAPASFQHDGKKHTLAARTVLIVKNGKVLLDTSKLDAGLEVRRSYQPVDVDLAKFGSWHEPMPQDWPEQMAEDEVVADEPVEQLLITRDRSDYCWYSTKIRSDGGRATLTLDKAADVVYVFVNGKLAASTKLPLLENRELDKDDFKQEFELKLKKGKHRLSILCAALGLIKGDWMLGQHNMVEEKKGIFGRVFLNHQPLKGPWHMQGGLVGERGAIFGDGGELVNWKAGKAQAGRPLRWYRATFARPDGNDPVAVDLQGMNKGLAYLNGQCIGRYWLIIGAGHSQMHFLRQAIGEDRVGQPSQRYYHLPAEWLKDRNTLVLFEEAGGDPARVRICRWR